MQSVLSIRLRQAAGAAVLLAALWAMPAAALDLFARHTVAVEFAASDGKPIADAEVRVFAPGQPSRPALTGRTDSAGKFEFPANTDGLWSAEAHSGSGRNRAGHGPGRRHGGEGAPVAVLGGRRAPPAAGPRGRLPGGARAQPRPA